MIKATVRKTNGPSFKIKRILLDNNPYYVVISNLLSVETTTSPIFDNFMDALSYTHRFFDNISEVITEIHK